MEKGADPNCVSDDGWWSPLIVASSYGHDNVVELLLDKGANPNVTDHVGNTSVIYASLGGFNSVIDCFIKRGADLNQKNFKGLTPLISAVKKGNIDTVRFLLNNGADPSLKNKRGKTALSYAIYRRYDKILDVILSDKKSLHKLTNQKDSAGNAPLHIAVKVNNLKAFEKLLNKGANLYARCRYDETPLMHASKEGMIDIVKSILNNTKLPDCVNLKDKYGNPAIFMAVKSGNIDVVRSLLLYDAENFPSHRTILDCRNNSGENIFNIAEKSKDAGMLEFLQNWKNERNKLREEFVKAKSIKQAKIQAEKRNLFKKYIRNRRAL